MPKTLATVTSIAYVSSNIATFVHAKTDNWYANLNNAVTGVSVLKCYHPRNCRHIAGPPGR